MAEAQARFKPGVNVPVFSSTLITGGRFVKIVGDKTTDGDYAAGQCDTAGEWALGVAEQDAAPTTDSAQSVERRVNVIRPGAIARVKPGGAIARNTAVKTDTSGQAIAQGGTGVILGYTLYAVAGTEPLIEVALV